ncbi:MAG: hypothetical protein ACT4NU_01740 [Chromatiales bacterium]
MAAATGVYYIDQTRKEFVPTVSAVQTGTRLNFPNIDNIRHHVYSFPLARTFDFKLYLGTLAKPVIFDKPGTVIPGCNIHDRMVVQAPIVDTPYIALIDPAHLPARPLNLRAALRHRSLPVRSASSARNRRRKSSRDR